MRYFSWKTSDTNKSISVFYSRRGSFPVYLLVPKEFQDKYGKYIEEKEYKGDGDFGGHDVYTLVAIWNEPDRCKKDGKWLTETEIRGIGLKIACLDEDNARLKYPIKFVEDKNLDYDKVKPSVICPKNGYYYETPNELKINISIIPEEKNIFISEPSSSGCLYDYKDTADIVKQIEFYIYNYVEERLKDCEKCEEDEETEEL